jgi:alkanesulfonate monooxygenase SsuD/methylene tetrahydromethanopterin reductase-like flavin-dependent oxidoreductase (luciferase family)
MFDRDRHRPQLTPRHPPVLAAASPGPVAAPGDAAYPPQMSRPLAIGLQLPEAERRVDWPEYRDMVLAAEGVGFDSLWVGDHLLYRDDSEVSGPWEAWSLLAAIAAITTRVNIGPLVAATSFHAPAMLAKKAATVDEISGGRLILGLGAGWNEFEYRAFGFPFDHRASRFEEAFTIIRTLLSEGAIDFEGTYYSARDCELLPRPRPGGPPLMIGSQGPRVLAATLPHVHMWNAWFSWFGNRPEGLKKLLGELDVACERAGTTPKSVERSVAVMVAMPGATAEAYGSPGRSNAPPVDATELPELLDAYATLGISHVQLVVDPITVESIETLGEALPN